MNVLNSFSAFAVSLDTADVNVPAPPVPIEITKDRAAVMKLPGCAVGKTFKAEAVPTDVEMGPDGNLYVTSLPGGPEDPAMGANGGVFKIELATGTVSRISSGLTSPVGLAIGPDGTAYVSMLFASMVMKQELGKAPEVFAEVPFPGDVEVRWVEEHTDAHRSTTDSLIDAFTADRTAIAGNVGGRAVDELIGAHRLWSDWLARGRVRKFALVAEKTRTTSRER